MGKFIKASLLALLAMGLSSYALADNYSKGKANISISPLFFYTQAGYDYSFSTTYNIDTYLEITLSTSESVANTMAIGFDFGYGFFITDHVEITTGINYFSKSLTGNYKHSGSIQSQYDDFYYYEREATANPTLKETIFSFGVNFHPSSSGKVRPYFGGGGSYISGEIDLVKEFSVSYLGGLEKLKVDFEETSISKFGFYIKGGVNIEIINNRFVFVEGNYIIAKEDIPHPWIAKSFGIDENISINLGGFSISGGFKFFF